MKKYVVYYTNEDYPPATMYQLDAENDDAALRTIFDLDDPDIEDVPCAAQEAIGEGEFYMVYNVTDSKVIFGEG
jgi:hypothetical protein